MRLIIFILLVFTASSCSMQKWCAERYPPQVITETKVETEVKWRDTTIYVTLPADTVIQEKEVIVYKTPEGYQTDVSELTTQFAYSAAQVINGRLTHELHQKEAELEQTIKNAIKEQSTHTVKERVEVYEVIVNNFWTRLYRWFFWITLALGGGFIFAKMKRII